MAPNYFCQAAVKNLGKDSLGTKALELNVKLADDLKELKLPEHCGVFQTNNMTFKYNVIKVIKGEYEAKTILINFHCPNELIEKKVIENGKKYTYKLRPNQTQASAGSRTRNKEIEYQVME